MTIGLRMVRPGALALAFLAAACGDDDGARTEPDAGPAGDGSSRLDAGQPPGDGATIDSRMGDDAGAPDDSGPPPDAGDEPDAPTAMDSGPTPDTGLRDVGIADVGIADVGIADVGIADVGIADSAVRDSGTTDAGARDTGTALDSGAASCPLPADPGCCWEDADCTAGLRCYGRTRDPVCDVLTEIGRCLAPATSSGGDRACWADRDCPADQQCAPGFVCPCGIDCSPLADRPGLCMRRPPL